MSWLKAALFLASRTSGKVFMAGRMGRVSASSRAGVVALLFISCLVAYAAEEVTPIASILLNPTSYHRRPVILQGIAKEVSEYDGRDFINQPQCSQGFTLEDDTGAIKVVSMSKCQAGDERAVMLGEGDRVLIHATIEAPPDNFKDARGSLFDYKALATKVTRAKN
jgi:hypothetical protein